MKTTPKLLAVFLILCIFKQGSAAATPSDDVPINCIHPCNNESSEECYYDCINKAFIRGQCVDGWCCCVPLRP
ncbi:hypothetical protein MRB53_021400 [Persea americana]|uniref:Uncharacterized protein n=1 Tax=Persea americana TaxID=3435 RepID=A0ACC2L4Y2_PERAE|nr:hypothetical protein MRB53_021400 [Persea americana]